MDEAPIRRTIQEQRAGSVAPTRTRPSRCRQTHRSRERRKP
jgi:hypothetical protein